MVVAYFPWYFMRRPAWKPRPRGGSGFHAGSPSEVSWKICNNKCGFAFVPRLWLRYNKFWTTLNNKNTHNFIYREPTTIENCSVFHRNLLEIFIVYPSCAPTRSDILKKTMLLSSNPVSSRRSRHDMLGGRCKVDWIYMCDCGYCWIGCCMMMKVDIKVECDRSVQGCIWK